MGRFAKLQLQLQDVEEASQVLSKLDLAKIKLESCLKAGYTDCFVESRAG